MAPFRGKPFLLATTAFALLLAAFWFIAGHFHITAKLRPHPEAVVASFALILAPYWFFGFGAAAPIRRVLHSPGLRIAAVSLLVVPYLVFSLPRGEFQPVLFIELLSVLLLFAALLEFARGIWADYLALLSLAILVETYVFDRLWTVPGLSGLAKLIFVDLALYAYLVIRPTVEIGFDFRVRLRDFFVGLREFLYYSPFALALGFSLGFLHWHKDSGSLAEFAAAWIFTLFFIALPEEIFFRGLLMNLLAKHMSTRSALLLSSVLFGLAHFSKRTTSFNWRYVILASIAGFFYGRSYLATRRMLSAGITHATVDSVWSIWLR